MFPPFLLKGVVEFPEESEHPGHRISPKSGIKETLRNCITAEAPVKPIVDLIGKQIGEPHLVTYLGRDLIKLINKCDSFGS